MTASQNPTKLSQDQKLDRQLEDSFPASDPPSIVRDPPETPGKKPTGAEARKAACEKAAQERELDAELEDSFPASDPPAMTQPTGAGPADAKH